MTTARHVASAGALAAFGVLALGSGTSTEKSVPTSSSGAAKGNGALGSCMEADKTACREWHAWILDERAAKGECTEGVLGPGRKWSTDPCPTMPTLLGTCAETERDAKFTRFEYQTPTHSRSSSTSKEGCEATGGKWTDGPAADPPKPKPSAAPSPSPKPGKAQAKPKK